MSKLHGFILTLVALLLYASPAHAGKLLSWRFESNNNRLIFNTDDRVQPTAQLVPNPTRVVIDLPGITLGRPSVNQAVGGTVSSVRVAQFDAFTTRLVIEIAPGYTVDPQKVKVRGISPTQWTVDLPQPQPITEPSTSNPLFTPNQSPSTSTGNPQSRLPASSSGSSSFQVTQNGFFVRLDRNGSNASISPKRSEDGNTITFDLPDAVFSNDLNGQTIAVNQYGVGDVQFSQNAGTPQIRLNVAPNSPNWQANYSRLGGLVLFPQGGTRTTTNLTPPPSSGIPLSSLSPSTAIAPTSFFRGATITGLDLSRDNRQLIIQADRQLQATGNWNRLSGIYEIRINNAQLANSLKGPQLGRNSPIYQLRIRQEEGNVVVIAAQPSSGTRFGRLNQIRNDLVALEISSPYSSSISSNPTYPDTSYPIPSNPPSNRPLPPSINFPPVNTPRPVRGQRLVFIDPGHGGKDPGAIGINGLQEKDVILPVSLYIAQYLEQQGIRVMLARNSDYFVSLQGRTDMANRAGADVFVSIHANSMGMGRPDVSGLEVYYFGNRGLSDVIYRSIVRTVNVKERGVRQARFYVLRNSRMPSTLVELGFVTGYEDASKLADPNYQRQMAQAIAQGIIEYLQQNR